MLAIDRKNKIIEILQKEKIVKVERLSEIFGVSDMTVRRDLEKCEKEGLVHRCHGGAVLKSDISHEIMYADKKVYNLESKDMIAQYCAGLVKPGNTLYLDAGTTLLRLAMRLVNVPDLTVVTNDLAIASLLSESQVNIIMLGGVVTNSLRCVHGPTAERMLRDLRIEITFAGGQSVNEDFDLFATTEPKVYFRRILLEQSNRAYLLVDRTKFYRHSLHRVHNLSEYTAVITDKRIIDTEQRYLEERGINLISLDGWDGQRAAGEQEPSATNSL